MSSRSSGWLPPMISPIAGADTSIAATVLPFVLRLQVDAPFHRKRDPVQLAIGFRRQSDRPLAKRRWRTPVGCAKCVVESPDAAEPGGECDLRERHGCLIDQPFRSLHALGRGDFARSSTHMAKK